MTFFSVATRTTDVQTALLQESLDGAAQYLVFPSHFPRLDGQGEYQTSQTSPQWH
jgi:hypothetical protein